MNTIINFETAKLLKEKGFDLPIRTAWYLEDVAYWNYAKNHNESNVKVSAPTIAEVVMWLYEKHGIWVWVEKYYTLFRPYAEEIGSERFGKWEGHKFNSPTEAYQEAIKYCLTKLI